MATGEGRTGMRGTTCVTGVAVLLLALAGCGDGSSSVADPPTGSPSSSTGSSSSSHAVETCPYLDADQVSAAVGAETVETAGTVNACFFDPVGGDGSGPSVMLSRIDVQIDPKDYAIQTRALCKGEVTDVEVGDHAFACVMGLGPQGQVYDGRVLVTVNVNGAADDAAGIADAVALIREVTIPPTA